MYKILIIGLLMTIIGTLVQAGCYQKRLCCKGRNMTCVSTEISHTRNVFNADNAAKHGMVETTTIDKNDVIEGVITDKEVTSAERHRQHNWHLHVPDMKLMDNGQVDNFTQWLYNSALDNDANDDHLFQPAEFENMKLPDYADLDQSGFYEIDDLDTYGSGDDITEQRRIVLEGENLSNETTKTEKSVDYVDPLGGIRFSNTRRRDDVNGRREKIEFNGNNDKEISYVIIGGEGGSSGVDFGRHRIGLLQHDDKNMMAKKCYCDEDCRLLNDCCSDFVEACPSNDCEVSAWSSWGPCQTGATELANYRCGPGVSKRLRAVVEQSSLGGVPCPHLEEQKACYNAEGECGSIVSEVALLLPYKYSSARTPGYKNNIYYDLPRTIAKLSSMPSYCSIFESYWLDISCRDADIRRSLQPGAKVCVECQPTAQKSDYFNKSVNVCTGHGVIGTKTIWSMISAKNCAGQWTLIEMVSKCQCQENYPEYPNYIFV